MASAEVCPREVTTDAGIRLKTVYTEKEQAGFDASKELGLPGEYPFTRGIYPNMYRGRLWTIRQNAGYGSPQDTNERYKYLLTQGETGINYVEDQPTKLGLDSDHPSAYGEIGREGVPIDTVEDMKEAFKDIPLDRVSVSMVTNRVSSYAMFLVMAQEYGFSWRQVRGTIRNDVFTCYNASKSYTYPPEHALRLALDASEFFEAHVPRFNLASFVGQHYRQAGATAVQEMGFVLAGACAYMEALKNRGLDLDRFAPRVSFFLDIQDDFFEEIAKFRAARRLWAKLMREKYGTKNPNSWKFRFAAQTSGTSLTVQEPENNIIRTTLHALAAVLGGVQSLTTDAYNEAFSLPTEKTARIAVRTQQIIAYESGIPRVVDPLGGSYFLEELTCTLEREVSGYLQKIEGLGKGSILQGMLRATREGHFQREVTRSAYEKQKAINEGKKIIVGVNKFTTAEKPEGEVLKIPLMVQEEKIKSLRRLKERRDERLVREKLAALKEAARSNENVMPKVIEAVSVYATHGEITATLKEVFGAYQETPVF